MTCWAATLRPTGVGVISRGRPSSRDEGEAREAGKSRAKLASLANPLSSTICPSLFRGASPQICPQIGSRLPWDLRTRLRRVALRKAAPILVRVRAKNGLSVPERGHSPGTQPDGNRGDGRACLRARAPDRTQKSDGWGGREGRQKRPTCLLAPLIDTTPLRLSFYRNPGISTRNQTTNRWAAAPATRAQAERPVRGSLSQEAAAKSHAGLLCRPSQPSPPSLFRALSKSDPQRSREASGDRRGIVPGRSGTVSGSIPGLCRDVSREA